MGTTGSSADKSVNLILPPLVSRVRAYTSVPLAVGFGVYNRHHFEVVADAGADGVVTGSRVVDVIGEAGPDLSNITKKIRSSCAELTLHGQPKSSRLRKHTGVSLASPPLPSPANGNPPQLLSNNGGNIVLPARFGQFGGQYVPEALVDCLVELEEAHKAALIDPEFWKEFEGFYGYINRPSQLYEAKRLTETAGGARIWLKREDL